MLVGILSVVRCVSSVAVRESIGLVGGSARGLVPLCVQIWRPSVLGDALMDKVRGVLRQGHLALYSNDWRILRRGGSHECGMSA